MTEESDASELARLTAEIDELARYADAQEQKVRQLEGALESRVVIERAVGMLAERFGVSVADAFELLRSAARHSRRELRALAADVTVGGVTPAEVVAARARA